MNGYIIYNTENTFMKTVNPINSSTNESNREGKKQFNMPYKLKFNCAVFTVNITNSFTFKLS